MNNPPDVLKPILNTKLRRLAISKLTYGTAEKEQAMNNQEAADAKGKMMADDESLAREIQRQDQESIKVEKKVSLHTPFKEQEVTPKEVSLSALFSGKKNL